MGNILGEPFKKYVDKQIKKRQEIHGKVDRTTEEISYLNSTNAWIKLASGVSLTQERLNLLHTEYNNPLVTSKTPTGKYLAMQNVLFNGVTRIIDTEDEYQQQQRTDFLGKDGTYGMGGYDFGIVPMPGIVSMDSQDLNRGSIKKTRVRLKAYNKNQFDVLDVLYLRLGYTVLLEFGNNRYWDSGDDIKQGTDTLTSMGPTLIDQEFFEVDEDYYDLLLNIEKKRREFRGNYDAILGKVQNFSWTFAPDGTYDIDLDIISIGDVIESLKVNLPPFNQDPNTTKDRQIIRNEFKDNKATNIDDLDKIYPGIIPELTKWYNDAATTNKINIKYTLGNLPNIRGDKSIENRDYGIIRSEGKFSIPLTNKDFNTTFKSIGGIVQYGSISVENVPTKNEIDADLLGNNNLDYYLKEAVKFAIIMKINGYYGGSGFRNPLDGNLYEKEPNQEKRREQGSPWKLNENSEPIKKRNLGETLITAHSRIQSIIDNPLNYSADSGKTTEGLVGTNSMPSNITPIKGYYKINQLRDTTSEQDVIPSLSGKELTTATFINQSYKKDKFQPYVKGTIDFAPTATLTPPNINYNNSNKSKLLSFNRHSALHLLLLKHGDEKSPDELDETDIRGQYPTTEKFYIQSQHNLLENLPLDEFLQLVLLFFKELGAAGGTEDNQFQDQPEYASWGQELEYEKSRNRIYDWFYKIRKYYTGIQLDNNPKSNLQGETQMGQKFGFIKMEHRVSSENLNTARNIGFILNPTNVDAVYAAEQKRKQIEKEQEKNNLKNPLVAENIISGEVGDLLFPEEEEEDNLLVPFLPNSKAILYTDWNRKVGYPKYRGTSIEKIDAIVLDKTSETGQFDLDPRYKFFIRLGTLLRFVQDKIIPQIVPNQGKKVPLIKIDTDSSSNICYAIDNMMSSDIRSCIIRNEKVYAQTGLTKLFVGPSGQGIENFFPPSKVGEYIYGRPMNVYMNFEFIQAILDDLVGNNGEAALFDFLKKICNEINKCLGYVNNLEPTINYDTNTITIIDQTPIPGIEEIAAVLTNDFGRKVYRNFSIDNPAVLEVYGYNPTNNQSTFVHNIGLTTGISKRYASMITIGATANGSVPGSEATAFSKWNIGVEDRVKPQIVDPEADGNQLTIDEQNQGVIKTYVKTIVNSNYQTNFYKLIQLNSKGALEPEYVKANGAAIENFYKYAQAKSSEKGSLESSVGFLPFNLKVDMEGLSGIKIYNRIHVDTRFLPSNYPQTLDFIVTKVNHKLQNNKWDTTLETQATRILKKDEEGNIINTPDLLGNDKIQEYVEAAIKSQIKSASQTQRDLAVTPPAEYTGTNGNIPDSELQNLSEIGFPNRKLAKKDGCADNWIKMWGVMESKGIKLPTVIGPDGAYRDYKGQYDLFDIDLFVSSGGTKAKPYAGGVIRAVKGSGGKTACAYPGRSNHGLGKSIDIGGRDKKYQKMRCFIRENGATYGWGWEEGKSVGEPWHFTYYGIDNVDDSGYKGKSPCK